MYWDENSCKLFLTEEEKMLINDKLKECRVRCVPEIDKLTQYNVTEEYNYIFGEKYDLVVFLSINGSDYDFNYNLNKTLEDKDSNSLLCFVSVE